MKVCREGSSYVAGGLPVCSGDGLVPGVLVFVEGGTARLEGGLPNVRTIVWEIFLVQDEHGCGNPLSGMRAF